MVKRKAETLAQSSPDVLEPHSVTRQRKTPRPPSALTPKRLAYLDKVEPSATAYIAAAQCGLDEGQMAAMLMERPVMAATRVLDFTQNQGSWSRAEESLAVLLQHFSSAFVALGGNAAAVFDEWTRLNRMVIRDASLSALPLEELNSRVFLHFQSNHSNLLLLAALSHAFLPWTWF